MIKIRLDRKGIRNKPFYRIIAIDKNAKKGAPALDTLGYWHPKKDLIKIEKEKIKKWVELGAKISTAVDKLIK